MKVIDIIKICEHMTRVRVLREVHDADKDETYNKLINEFTSNNWMLCSKLTRDVLDSEIKSISTSNKGLLGTLIIII